MKDKRISVLLSRLLRCSAQRILEDVQLGDISETAKRYIGAMKEHGYTFLMYREEIFLFCLFNDCVARFAEQSSSAVISSSSTLSLSDIDGLLNDLEGHTREDEQYAVLSK